MNEIVLKEGVKQLETKAGLQQIGSQRLKERLIEKFFLLNGVLAILILGGIFALLFFKAYPAFKELGIIEFFGSAVWNPNSYSKAQYGILSLIISSLMVTLGALLIAIPLEWPALLFFLILLPRKCAKS